MPFGTVQPLSEFVLAFYFVKLRLCFSPECEGKFLKLFPFEVNDLPSFWGYCYPSISLTVSVKPWLFFSAFSQNYIFGKQNPRFAEKISTWESFLVSVLTVFFILCLTTCVCIPFQISPLEKLTLVSSNSPLRRELRLNILRASNSFFLQYLPYYSSNLSVVIFLED